METKAGTLIANAREAKGMTHEELARAIGVTVPFIYHIENFIRNPSVPVARALSDVLEIPLDVLLSSKNVDTDNERYRGDQAFRARYEVMLYDCDPVQIGVRIKAARNKIGITQIELARKVYLTSGAMSMIETGKHKPTIDNAIALSAVLGIPIDEFLNPNQAAHNGS